MPAGLDGADMRCNRYSLEIPKKGHYPGGMVFGLLKGMAKGQAVVRTFNESDDTLKITVRVKAGLDDFFVGQSRSFGWIFKLEERT